VIWEPFILALVLGIIVSAGLYFAYLWPSVEPVEASDGEPVAVPASPVAEPQPLDAAGAGLGEDTRAAAASDDAVGTAAAAGVAEKATTAAEQPTVTAEKSTDAAAGDAAAAGPAASPAP
jgi:hypothetical protein